jgi:hypothetical protein
LTSPGETHFIANRNADLTGLRFFDRHLLGQRL